jgi:RecG-like helicase
MEAVDRRTAVAAFLMLGSGLLAGLFGSVDVQGFDERSVASILQERPLGEQVQVEAEVVEMKEPYKSSSGTTYQRFLIGSEEKRLLVFCKATNGKVNVSREETVAVEGRVKEFKGTLEIKTPCFRVHRKG